MTLTFNFRNKYKVDRSIDAVRNEIETIADRKWHDFSENISAKFIGKRSFEFTSKWSFGSLSVMGIQQDFTFVIGTLLEDGRDTVISTESRPHYALVIIFYLFLFLPIGKLFDLNFLAEMALIEIIIVSSIFVPLIGGLMIFQTVKLRSRVERILRISR